MKESGADIPRLAKERGTGMMRRFFVGVAAAVIAFSPFSVPAGSAAQQAVSPIAPRIASQIGGLVLVVATDADGNMIPMRLSEDASQAPTVIAVVMDQNGEPMRQLEIPLTGERFDPEVTRLVTEAVAALRTYLEKAAIGGDDSGS